MVLLVDTPICSYFKDCCWCYFVNVCNFAIHVRFREAANGKRVNSWLPPDKQFLVTRGVACHKRVRDIEASLNANVRGFRFRFFYLRGPRFRALVN